MPEQKERIKRRKENQRLAMENDILKRAVLIMGRDPLKSRNLLYGGISQHKNRHPKGCLDLE
ncbi:hypothetical protein ABC3671 [Shouchella clausii KSM-K16]|uniref:Transposase n=1 Tax=Shouchella clausii (strain KSM-K16) TaxID=66692 RepID=Q5WBQ6_SHOC1|nr:hypothetical protein CHH70_01035 [Shouchella clausii]BAD66204.1 hypothetical protein ABC3671 [Shouchella clausii KSM-K16]